uniref:Cytochrome P450 71B2-3 n=1 Tax=Isatis tinctoria TaxID=161756 RepID=A0A8F0FS43_ISATI|nr:cytochrome P450 71B2-3 [Isatis tinctoria]
MSIFLWFICFLSFFIVSSFIFSKKLQPSKWKLPPSPSSLPLIGNLHHMISDLPHKCMHKLSLKYGPVMLVRLGSIPVVVISSSEAAEEVLKTHDLECSTRSKMVGTEKLSYGFKDIIFGQYGEYWREMRKVAVMELFSPKKVQSFRYVREQEMELMVKKVSALTQSPVDLSKTFFSLTASIVCRVALGQNFHDCEFIDQDKIEEMVTEAADALGSFTFTDLFPGGFGRPIDWLFGTHKRLNEVFKELDAFYQHVIDDHLKESSERKSSSDSPTDIVAVMLDIINRQGKDDYFKLNNDNIKAVLMRVFVCCSGCVSCRDRYKRHNDDLDDDRTLRNPRVMKKVQEEIRTTLGTKKEIITEEDLNKVDYLKLIIKETFRLHPPVPIVTRQAMSHVKIKGYDIPPKTTLQINIWTIGRDPKRWSDPEDFIPERFTNSSVDFKGQNYNLLPFGSGRRICPAIAMSIAVIELALLNLIYFFNWTLPDGMRIGDIDMEEAGSLSVVKKLPLMLVPVQR